ncbi:MAG TPA: AraC family transcriptional regulator [Actinomycetota bacterium]|nr:AraC family transcriptional regulator [Actinomycetota bacterium]
MTSPGEWVRAWKPAVPGIHEVFHARFVDHAYPPHTHEAWTVFIVDEGAIRYDLETRHRGAAGDRVTILPPSVVHDGRPATGAGFRKRVLYLGSDVLEEDLIGRAVDEPDIEDRTLVRELGSLHGMLADPDANLAAEAALADVRSRIRAHLGARPETLVDRPSDVASDLRDLLDDHLADRITLADAGRTLHASPGHLVRCFSRTFRIAPHRYLLARRIESARHRLLQGEAVAEVAVGVGFHDQAHLTRHFRRHVGTTPASYASAIGRRGGR